MKPVYIMIGDRGDKHYYSDRRMMILHREDGPAIEYPHGYKEWWRNGWLHRENGPAMEWSDGSKFWYAHGEFHREDGPAVEYVNGYKEWYLEGVQLTEEEFNKRTKPSCADKVVEIDGKKYKLTAI